MSELDRARERYRLHPTEANARECERLYLLSRGEARMSEAALEWKHQQTDRGFVRIDFTDEYGKACSLQESSLATQDCIWLGVDGEGQRMHLTPEHVRALLPYLQRFVDSGALPLPGEDLKAPYGDGNLSTTHD